jgi:integrase
MPAKQALQYSPQRLKVYTLQEIEHCERSKWIAKYVAAAKARAPNSAHAYKFRLQIFSSYLYAKFDKVEVDAFIEGLKADKHDPYDVLRDFLTWQKSERKQGAKLSANVINAVVRTTKKFLRFSKVKIDTEEFSEQVQLLRKEKPVKLGVEKGDVIKLLNAAVDIRLKTAILGLASLGPRPIELCAVRNRDISLEGDKPTVTFRAEFSKMREARTRPLTKEFANQCKVWRDHKYRVRRTSVIEDGRRVMKVVTPKSDPDDLFIGHIHFEQGREITPEGLYSALQQDFAELVDLVYREAVRNAGNGRNRNISLKTFRDLVKTTISDTGHQDYSEWFIGHSASTYYQKSEKEKAELFRKMEPYLTYLDVTGLEAKGADQDTRISQLQTDLQKERERTANLYEQLYAQGLIKKEE